MYIICCVHRAKILEMNFQSPRVADGVCETLWETYSNVYRAAAMINHPTNL